MRTVCLGLVMLLGACEFPTRADRYACLATADCEAGRTCEQGYCVEVDAGRVRWDARPNDAAVPDADLLAAQCPAAGYTYLAGPAGYYRSVGTGTSWTNAQAACKADVAGATHLIVLSTEAEVTYMKAQHGWIGLSDRITENVFDTVTGEAGDLRPWGNGQPDNSLNAQDCVHMNPMDSMLHDDQCGTAHRYECECDGKMSTP